MTPPILLIEDNPITCKVVRATLTSQGYELLDASTGSRGIELFLARDPALVLLDLVLPDVQGFDLFYRLRGLPRGKDVPVLAFSGLLSPQDESRLADVGFDDVVSKPVEPSRLLQIVRGYLPLEVPAVTAKHSRQLIVADDDAVQRKMVALRLRRAGFSVTVARDGQEALERARTLKPDAIVSDVLMPRLDGFGLCMAVRNDPELASTPVVLISNSYLDPGDKQLALRSGASEMLLRTPELHDVIALLGSDELRSQVPLTPVAPDPDLERERIQRMMSQLERQVAMYAGLNQRCSLLAAELSVLSGISEAVATEHDIESALHQVLASCFDAGGISLGLMYLHDGGELRGMRYGAMESWSQLEVASFFGFRGLLEEVSATQTTVSIPSTSHPEHAYRDLLLRTGCRSLTIAPLGKRGAALGALVTMSRSLEIQPSDQITFAQAVAGQISLALSLAKSFQAKAESEREARANATLLRSILESMAEGVIVASGDGVLKLSNHAANDILPESWRDFAFDPERPLYRALHGEHVTEAEVSLPGTDRWIRVSSRPLVDDAAEVQQAVAVFRDITEERAARARMLVSERMASLGTLAAGVGHEINNPLMSAIGNLEMAITDVRRLRREHAHLELEELVEELRDAKEAAERVRNIVRDLKLFSRADEDTRENVDVVRVLESSVRMVGNEIRHRATLVRDYQPVPPVYANESRLGQVFLNLLVNAAQAIPEGRASSNEITVRTSVAVDGRVRIAISDTGLGMTPETVNKIFTPFFTTKPIGVGTGLGLAICHQLITSKGGEIVVDSNVGVGSTFTVLLPPAGGAELPRLSRTSTLPPATRRGRVFIIDDDKMVVTTIRRALARDHEVIALTSPREALHWLERDRNFDLILCDLMMPDMTGMELHAAIHKLEPALAERMVFITGGAFTDAAREFLATTSNAHIEKPIEIDTLRRFINDRVKGGRV